MMCLENGTETLFVCVVEVLIRYGQYKHGMAMDYEGYFLFVAYV